MRKENGITLIALVITIIILIILAGVGIKLLVGENGLITKAQEAKINMINAQEEEESTVQSFYNKMLAIEVGGNVQEPDPPDPTDPPDPSEVPLPNGFVVVGGDIENGYIISDAASDEGKGTGWQTAQELIGNQFVWIPVKLPLIDATSAGTNETAIEKAITDNIDTQKGIYPMAVKLSDGTYRGILYEANADGTFSPIEYSTSGSREPDVLESALFGDEKKGVLNGLGPNGENLNLEQWKTQLQREYKDVVDNIVLNGGFYIARYEASLATNGKLESKQGNVVMTSETTSGNTWWGMYQKSKNLNTSVANTKTGMIWGSQWDQMLIYMKDVKNIKDVTKTFLEDSSGMGVYSAWNSAVSGSNADYAVKEIYDIAGNLWDWTIESESNRHRVARGGDYSSAGSMLTVTYRKSETPTLAHLSYGVRLVLSL